MGRVLKFIGGIQSEYCVSLSASLAARMTSSAENSKQTFQEMSQLILPEGIVISTTATQECDFVCFML
jgi:hypothetical protein